MIVTEREFSHTFQENLLSLRTKIHNDNKLFCLLEFDEIDLSNDEERQEFYKRVGEGVSTVPQIYIDNIRIGGYPNLVTWFEENGF